MARVEKANPLHLDKDGVVRDAKGKAKIQLSKLAEPELRIEYVDLDVLEKWPRNPKEHNLPGLQTAFNKFGFVDPIIIDEKTGKMVSGHGRTDTLKQMHVIGADAPKRIKIEGGKWLVPVLRGISFDSDALAEGYLLASNQLTISGGYRQDELLGTMLADLQKFDLLDALGFQDDQLQALMNPKAQNGNENGSSTSASSNEPAQEVNRFPIFDKEKIIELAFQWYRKNGFPYPKLTLHEQMQEINKLAATNQEAALATNNASRVADAYHPERFACHALGMKAPVASFKNDKTLRIAIDLSLSWANISTGYISKLDLTQGTQACGNFRPGVAMYIYRQFGKKNGLVLDPSAGFGGRIVGWLASHIGGRYIGVDPNPLAVKGNRDMVKALGFENSIELIQSPFEDIDLKKEKLSGAVDLVFTSPPYFCKETYSKDSTQSYLRYPKIDQWISGFLRPLFERCFKALRPKGLCAINIADVKIKTKVYPLELLTQQSADAAGFKHVETINVSMSSGNKYGKGEHISSIVQDVEGDEKKQIEPVFIFEKK